MYWAEPCSDGYKPQFITVHNWKTLVLRLGCIVAWNSTEYALGLPLSRLALLLPTGNC
jgi:hypothetical protein